LRLPAEEKTEVKVKSKLKEHTEIKCKNHVYSLQISYSFHNDACVVLVYILLSTLLWNFCLQPSLSSLQSLRIFQPLRKIIAGNFCSFWHYSFNF